MEAKIQEMAKAANLPDKNKKVEVPVMPLFMLINSIGELEDYVLGAIQEAGAGKKMLALYKRVIELSKDSDYLENII